MSGSLTRFCIEGLHKTYTFDIPITDNKLVLVGENGTGKSTVANFIFFFLTGQWERMRKYQFKRVTAIIDGEEFQINKNDIDDYVPIDSRLTRRLPARIIREIERVVEQNAEDIPQDHEELVEYVRFMGLPSIAAEYFYHLTNRNSGFVKLKNIEKQLSEVLNAQILYLPTYRRIEQELSEILVKTDLENPYGRARYDITKRKGSNYEELVQFGMDDVKEIIRRKMNQIKDRVRADLNQLTGVHLRDVIRRAYQTVNPNKIISLDESTISDIFRRTQAILYDQDQNFLRETIAKIQKSKQVDDDDKIVAHFLIQLIELYEKQQAEESDIREFVDVCNKYFLEDKQFVYDNQNFKMYIEQTLPENKPRQINMPMLSSGEKQIVSLFSHIYLTDQKNYFVIIDEPELSISVPWQKMFLPDIVTRCSGLIAVTHSPFIFDNEMRQYAHSLEEFTKISSYDPEADEEYDVSVDLDDIPF